mmetsp:Transcript_17649/g.40433  ORF Transcript_17649/g.40433 Transcript_17649/m.40433 type:complete len:179 (-) Transcript_17649:86-622(-)
MVHGLLSGARWQPAESDLLMGPPGGPAADPMELLLWVVIPEFLTKVLKQEELTKLLFGMSFLRDYPWMATPIKTYLYGTVEHIGIENGLPALLCVIVLLGVREVGSPSVVVCFKRKCVFRSEIDAGMSALGAAAVSCLSSSNIQGPHLMLLLGRGQESWLAQVDLLGGCCLIVLWPMI